MIAFGLVISACGTSKNPSVPAGAASNPSPISEKDLQATSDVIVQQTMQAMPTPTLQPSNTPVVVTQTPTIIPSTTSSPTLAVTATQTQNPILLTLTATLGTGTPSAGTIIPGNTSGTVQTTVIPDFSTPATEPAYPQTYGTMPPNLPFGKVTVYNQAKTEAYVSLQCTTKDGYVSIIEYPLSGNGKTGTKMPAGSCRAVAYVGGNPPFSANFKLRAGGNASVTITNKGITAK